MPETLVQWLWFVFFAGGSLGGWVVMLALGYEIWRGWKKVHG